MRSTVRLLGSSRELGRSRFELFGGRRAELCGAERIEEACVQSTPAIWRGGWWWLRTRRGCAALCYEAEGGGNHLSDSSRLAA
jgi:hypothetical protein